MNNLTTREDLIISTKNKLKIENDTVDIICDIFMETMFEFIKEGNSINYGENFPIMKTKIKIGKLNDKSPRTLRDDYVLTLIKFPLHVKAGKKVKD